MAGRLSRRGGPVLDSLGGLRATGGMPRETPGRPTPPFAGMLANLDSSSRERRS